jgi:hypothetical protein
VLWVAPGAKRMRSTAGARVGVSVGGTVVLVGGTRVDVGSGVGVLVGGTEVGVGSGVGVLVGDTGVDVGSSVGVALGGRGVGLGELVGSKVATGVSLCATWQAGSETTIITDISNDNMLFLNISIKTRTTETAISIFIPLHSDSDHNDQ